MTEPVPTASPKRRRPLWVVWQLILHRPGLFSLHLAFITMVAYALPLVPGLAVRGLLDELSGVAPAGPNAATFIGVLAAWSLVGLLSGLVGPLTTITLRQHAEVLQRTNLLHRVLDRPGANALPASSGDSLVRVTKDPAEVSHALDFLGDPVGQAIGFTFVFVLLARIDAFLTVAVVLPATAVMLVARLLGPRIADARRQRQAAISDVSGLLGDAFSAVATVQAAGAESRVTAHLVELGEARRRATLRDLAVDQVVTSFSTNTATVATGVLLVLAASDARAGSLSAGDFVVFTSYLRWLATAVSFVGYVSTTLRQAGVSVERMGDVLQGPAEGVVARRPIHLKGPLPSDAPAKPVPSAGPLTELQVGGLTFIHPSSARGIRDVSFTVARNELVVVTGRIGSGKTTLLRALLGLLPPDAGTVRWNGAAVADAGRFFVPPRVAYTAQVPRLFSAPLIDNVTLGLEVDDRRLRSAAVSAVFDRDLDELADGWQTSVGSRGVMLSGGQLQRAAAARMFVRQGELLVFDDLSSALDVETEEELWRRLFATASGTSYLVVTHRKAVLERADRIIVLREGTVESTGGLRQLLEESAEMRALWSGGRAGSRDSSNPGQN